MFWLVLLAQLCAVSASIASKNSTTKDDEAVARTLARIYGGHESGRLIGLFCRNRCLRQRELISKWVRTFNEGFNTSMEDRADFHFHSYKKPLGLPSVDTVLNQSSIAVFYFVADQGFQYSKDLNSEFEFKEWLKRYEHAPIRQVDDQEGLSLLLNEALTNCNENSLRYLLMVQDLIKCTDVLLPNIARSFIQDPTISVIELRRPLSLETEATLIWRLPGLSNSCRMIVFLYKGAFYEVDKNALPSKLYVMLKEWEGGECNATSSFSSLQTSIYSHSSSAIGTGEIGTVNNIRPELTDLQLEYVTEEMQIWKIQDNQVYIAVGAIGGLAIIALAVSIFWGLQSA